MPRWDTHLCGTAVAAAVICTVFAAGCKQAAEQPAPGATPVLTDAQKQQRDQWLRQSAMSIRTAAINRSNLAPDVKQRMIQQVQASGGK